MANKSMNKSQLKDWVLEALGKAGGSGSVTDVARQIWTAHEDDLKKSGHLFYTWQYDMRWAAQSLQDEGKITKKGKQRAWALAGQGS